VPLRTVLLLACDIARGLAHLHERGVVHADLSSTNVLLQSTAGRPARMSAPGTAGASTNSHVPDVGPGFVAKLCDFGLSGRLDVEVDATHLSGPARCERGAPAL
jgi:serine/threonine protein kinase